MFGKTIQSFRYALRGLKTVWQEERNFKIETGAGIVAIAVATTLRFSALEWALVVISIILVITGEIINTVIEDTMNKIEPAYDPVVGRIKDMMAGYVLLTSCGAVLLGILALIIHFS